MRILQYLTADKNSVRSSSVTFSIKTKELSVIHQLSTEGPSLQIKQSQFSSLVIRTSEKQKDDTQVAEFCYATNCSLCFINLPEFRKL